MIVHDRVDVRSVLPMTEKEYYARGCTTLLDAVGSAIQHIQTIHKYAREEDIPERTLFVITTDGMENASHNFTTNQIKAMIEKQKEKCGWGSFSSAQILMLTLKNENKSCKR